MQLHGDGSRAALPVLLSLQKRIIYVLQVNDDGRLLNSVDEEESSQVDWLLVDSAKGGRLEIFSILPVISLKWSSQNSPLPPPKKKRIFIYLFIY